MPPFALMSATTAFIVVSAFPISGARFCSRRAATRSDADQRDLDRVVGDPDGVAGSAAGLGGGCARREHRRRLPIGSYTRRGRRARRLRSPRSRTCDGSSSSRFPPDSASNELSSEAPKPTRTTRGQQAPRTQGYRSGYSVAARRVITAVISDGELRVLAGLQVAAERPRAGRRRRPRSRRRTGGVRCASS